MKDQNISVYIIADVTLQIEHLIYDDGMNAWHEYQHIQNVNKLALELLILLKYIFTFNCYQSSLTCKKAKVFL